MKKFQKPTTPKKARSNQPDKTQPKKNKINKTTTQKINTKQKVYKSQKITPTKNTTIKEGFIRRNDTPKERKHPEYGTSGLEEKFAKQILDKLGVDYQYQFKAESIGRYFDFRIGENGPIFEVNGGYWHSDPRLYEGKELTPTQKKNKRVDKLKKKWADEHKIPIYYFWEKDINDNPKKIMEEIKQILEKENKRQEIKEQLKQRPKKY